MPDVQPTNNPVPSDHPADARDNFKIIDEFVNSRGILTSPSRTGRQILTLTRYNELVQPNIDGAEAAAVSAAASAAAAEAAVSGLDYQGLWPDSGGSANKGDTYQTQVGGTGTGRYFTALQSTTVDPVSDNVNWRPVVSFNSVADLTEIYFNSVSEMVSSNLLREGFKVVTDFYNRPVTCLWRITSSANNSYGNYSIPLDNGGLHAQLIAEDKITPAMTGAPSSPGDSTVASIKAAEFFDKEFVLDGIYGISGSEPIVFREGQRVSSTNGPVTGSSIRSAFVALSPMDVMVDVSAAKYADINKVILDGSSTAQRGFKGTNVFGLSMSQCRTTNLTVTGFEFVNDGTGTGSFINSITKCYASLSPSGFVISSAAAESNLFVLNECVATDCSSYGFREFGDNTGRDNAYNDCDAEKCDIGFLMRSKNFNLVNPYVEFCNKGIVVDATGLASGVQSGRITSPSILGKFNFPGVPTEDSIGIEMIGFCRNIIIDNPWIVYNKTGIIAPSPVSGLTINEPFLENNDQDYDIQTRRYKIRKGSQESSITSLNTTDNVIVSDADNTIFVDLGNNNFTWSIDISSWLIGNSIDLVVMGDTFNTGTLTVSGSNGETLFGQNSTSRVGGSTSVAFSNGRAIKFIKQNDSTIYFVALAT